MTSLIKLKHISRSFFLAGFALIFISLSSVTFLDVKTTKAFAANEIISQTNEQRAIVSAKPLVADNKLMTAAQTKAENMASLHYFSHNAPDGTPPWKFITDTGYEYLDAGENLAITNQDTTSIITGWMNSPAHRDNVLNKNFTSTGIGMAFFGDYEGHKNTYIVVAFYAKPGSQANVPVAIQPTHPAGTISILKKDDFFLSLNYISIIALGLIIGGSVMEIIHLRHSTNKLKKANST